jgi:hypothetical protein
MGDTLNLHTRRLCAALCVVTACLLMPLHAGAARQNSGATSVLSATSLTFPGEPVATPSPSQALTLTNSGSATLSIVTIAISGTAFSETDTCDSAVAAGASCVINVTFDPISFGTAKGAMVITSNAPNSPQTVALEGTGIGPAVSLSSTAVNFPSQLVTTTSPEQTVVLSSSGDEALSVANIALTGPFNEVDTCLSSIVNPGTTCLIKIYFTPIAGGPATGTITITDNAFPALQTIALSGKGADFSVSLSPTTNSTSAGQNASYTVSVSPTGGFGGNVTLGCGGTPSGVSCSFSPSSVTVSGTGAATSALTVSTAGVSQAPPSRFSWPKPSGKLRLRPLWLWILLLGLSGLAVLHRRRRGLMVAAGAATALLLAVLMTPACGGSTTSTAVTLPATFNFVVTGTTTAGSASLQNNVVLTLVVN